MVFVVSRWPSILLLSLFVGGVVVGPLVHRAHCCDADVSAQTASGRAHGAPTSPADKPHNAETCPICHMAATAYALLAQPLAVGSAALPVVIVLLHADVEPSSLLWLFDAPPTGPPSCLA